MEYNPHRIEDGIDLFLKDAEELGLSYLELHQVCKSLFYATGAKMGLFKDIAPLSTADELKDQVIDGVATDL